MSLFKRRGSIDLVIVLGLFAAAAFFVLGLYPKSYTSEGRSLFLYTMMTIPVIMALYFIIVSFRRSFPKADRKTDSRLRTRITMLFIFVAVLPLIPVVIISNTILHKSVRAATSVDAMPSLERAIIQSQNEVYALADNLRSELESIKKFNNEKIILIDSVAGRSRIRDEMIHKGIVFQSLSMRPEGWENDSGDAGNIMYSKGVREYVGTLPQDETFFVSRITVDASPVVACGFMMQGKWVILYRAIPHEIIERTKSYKDVLASYKKVLSAKDSLQSFATLFMLIVAIVVSVLAIGASIYLADSITRPMLELADAAKSVASGNLDVVLVRDTHDEISALYLSFNAMTHELKTNRDAVYAAEKLKAWKDVSRRLIHEMKNPLTPIRLSAERIRKRFMEQKPDIASVVDRGTATIIEEVHAIERVLDEFTSFARMPEPKMEKRDFNSVVKSCVHLFEGHEKIIFKLSLDSAIGEFFFDKHLIRIALTNLIKNAIESMNGEGSIDITAELFQSEKVQVRISDKGAGITPEDLEKLFEPTFTRKKGGTGLGLAIVEKIALDHGGKVSCRSILGEGSVFTVEIPRITEQKNG